MAKSPAVTAGLPPEVSESIVPTQAELRLDKPQKKVPERRCIVTGESLARDPLLRFVASPPDEKGNCSLVFDVAEKLPGRGCYVSADPVLLQHAIDKKSFARTLKTPVKVPADLIETVITQITARILSALGLAKKSGALALGEEAVEQSMARDEALLAMAASDASARTAADLEAKAARYQINYIALPLDAATLGSALGRDNTVYLTLLDTKGAVSVGSGITRDCARLAPFVTRLPKKAGI